MLEYLRSIYHFPGESKQLLANTFICTVALFMVNPYVITHLPYISTLSSLQTAGCLGFGTALGSVLALFCSFLTRRASQSLLGTGGCVGLTIGAVALSSLSLVPASLVAGTAGLIFCVHRFSLNTMTTSGKNIQILIHQNKDQSRVFWAISLLFSIGGTVGPPLGALIISWSSFRTCLIMAAVLFATCAWNYAYLHRQLEVSTAKEMAVGKARLETGGSVACFATVISYFIYAQIFSYVQLLIYQNNPGTALIVSRNFFVAYAFTRILSSFFVFPFLCELIGSLSLIYFVGTLLSVFALCGITMNLGNRSLMSFSAIFAVGESLFGASSMPFINNNVRELKNISIHTALFTFCSTSLGLGGGQAAGAFIFSRQSVFFANSIWLGLFIFFLFCFGYLLEILSWKRNGCHDSEK